MVLVTAIFYGTGNYINWKTGMLCSIGGIIGSFIGSKLLAILKGKHLKLIFIIMLLFTPDSVTSNDIIATSDV